MILTSRKLSGENEKSSVDRLSKLREQIEEMNRQIQKAQSEYNLEKAAELQYGELPKLQEELDAEEEKIRAADLRLVHESVTDEEIARIVSRWTGIPVAKLTEGERNKILGLEDILHQRVVGPGTKR
jgi:ATP-dependent Clp protease ATP-binding subunit ClpB